MKKFPAYLFIITPFCIIFSSKIMANSLQIDHIQPTKVAANGIISISGKGFSSVNNAVEVIADYGDGLKYKLDIKKYSDTDLKVKVPDLGKNLEVSIIIKKNSFSSPEKSIVIEPTLQQKNSNIKNHHLIVGDKGEDIFKVNNKQPSCSQTGEIFDHANIHFNNKRFAEAQFVSLPETACTICSDIKIRWFNEPTGELSYQLQIFKRKISGICQENIR